MKTHKGYRYRIYPNSAQRMMIARILGCVRFVYNFFLEVRQKAWADERRSITYAQTSAMLTVLKRASEYFWLIGVDSMALQESLKDLDKAFKNFFEKCAGYPKFHAKHAHKQSYRTRNQNNGIRIEENHIILPRLGAVKAKISRLPEGRILNATVTRTSTGKYFVSLCVEEELAPKANKGGVIGLDLGIRDLYVDSNGYKEPNPKTLSKYEKRLRREQRSLSRMIEANISHRDKAGRPVWKKPLKECSNIQKQRLKIARIHEKICNIRTDNMHKVSTKLVNENQVIALESLNIKGMVKNHHLAKAISDASWSRFISMLEYKAIDHGCGILKVGTFFPSSQLCSSCGYKNPKVKDLKVRSWVCPVCGAAHDRDHNAAVNILNQALKAS